ncbi:MAG TPA: hypothetical protein VG826_28215 [Pirellulales bacterium]|nr:hypothetical protein [Pirellulales bacterium]
MPVDVTAPAGGMLGGTIFNQRENLDLATRDFVGPGAGSGQLDRLCAVDFEGRLEDGVVA